MNFLTAAKCRSGLFGLALIGAGLAGCSSDTPGGDFVRSTGLGPTVAPRPDFIEQSRPARLDYMPIGTTDPGRTTPARSAAEVKAAEAELDAVRDRSMAAGTAAATLGGTPPPPPLPAKPAANAKKPDKTKP